MDGDLTGLDRLEATFESGVFHRSHNPSYVSMTSLRFLLRFSLFSCYNWQPAGARTCVYPMPLRKSQSPVQLLFRETGCKGVVTTVQLFPVSLICEIPFVIWQEFPDVAETKYTKCVNEQLPPNSPQVAFRSKSPLSSCQLLL